MKLSAREIIKMWEESKEYISPVFQFEDFCERLKIFLNVEIDEELEKKKGT